MQIGVRLGAADKIIVFAVGSDAKIFRIIALETLPEIGSERQIGFGIIKRERNVFQIVERLPRHAGIGEDGPILLPSVGEDRGRAVGCGGGTVVLAPVE